MLCGGIPTIVDATFLRRAQRGRFAELAARCGVPLHLILCEAPEAVLRARVAERSRARRDPSEADLAVLSWQAARAELPTANEGMNVIRVDTARPDACDRALRRIRGFPPALGDQL